MYSFDVFDTLITRITATPEGIFLLMQRYLEKEQGVCGFSDEWIRNFPLLRIDSERNARRFHPKTEICLQQIYDVMGQSVRLSERDKTYLMELEERCELACTVGIENNIHKLKRLIAEGKKVILLSDMYLPAVTIRRMLLNVDKVFDKIPLYVSCEYGVTKSSGLLYAMVHKKENIEYSQWVHCGDNEISDVNMPRLFGIRSIKIFSPTLRSWEKAMADYFHLESDLMLQLVSGISKKLYRKKRSEAFQVGASCASLILIPYVVWVIQSALEMGISYLYFVARDGFLLKKIADIYIDKNHLNVKTKYLYGSRQAWGCEDRDKKGLLLQYLKQEFPVSDNGFGLVDTHGTGKSISRLAELLGIRMKAFYYVLLEATYGKNCDFYVYSADTYNGIIEALCRAPHGVTLGYICKDSRIIPQLSNCLDKMWDECGLNEYAYGIEEFAKELFTVCQKLHVNIELKEIGKQMLKYCSVMPDDIVAGFIGEMPHDRANKEEEWRYAPRLGKRDIFRIALKRTSQDLEDLYKGCDFQYSYKRLGKEDRKRFDTYEKCYRGFLGKIIHLTQKKIGERLRHKKIVKVILYAAGRYGKELYHRMLYAEGIDIVDWVDVNYMVYQKQGYPVNPIDTIRKQDYDQIVISLDSIPISELVKDMLISAGVEKKKIRLRDDFLKEFFSDNKREE